MPLIEIRDLKKYFHVNEGAIVQKKVAEVKAIDGVSFDIRKGETLGLVGESGCGKTTTGRCVMRLMPPTGGSIRFGEEGAEIGDLPEGGLRPFRRRMQMIFQDPHSSLNPRMTVKDIVS